MLLFIEETDLANKETGLTFCASDSLQEVSNNVVRVIEHDIANTTPPTTGKVLLYTLHKGHILANQTTLCSVKTCRAFLASSAGRTVGRCI